MDATHTPSPLAASDEQSQAPACQRGRTHGVYAPRLSEDASGAMHGSLGFNPVLASGAQPDAVTTEAFGFSRAQHDSATATAPRRLSAGATSTSEPTQQNANAVDLAQEEEVEQQLTDEEERLEQRLLAVRTARRARAGIEAARAAPPTREVKLEALSPREPSALTHSAWDAAPDEGRALPSRRAQ